MTAHHWYHLNLDVQDAINPDWQWPLLSSGQTEVISCINDLPSLFNEQWLNYARQQTGMNPEFAMIFVRGANCFESNAHTDAPIKNYSPARPSYWAINWSMAPDNRKIYWFDLPRNQEYVSGDVTPSTVGYYNYPLKFGSICDQASVEMQATLVRVDTPHWVGAGNSRRGLSIRFLPDVQHESWEWAVDWFSQRGLLKARS
jgi:hypothetical protein